MSMVFIVTGTCTLGVTTRDKDGNILESRPAQFTPTKDGGSVAVGLLDPETMRPIEITSVYGDWDAAGYMAEILKLLNPVRKINLPDLKEIVKAAYQEDGNDLLCDYCKSMNCRDCIIKEWKEELE